MHLVDGEKHLVLVDPIESALLYADFADAAFGNSPVDPAAVDLDVHPLAARAGIWPVRVRKGDVLYLPSGWWHLVTTRQGRSVMLTLQFNHPSPEHRVQSAAFSFAFAQQKLAQRLGALSVLRPPPERIPPLTLAVVKTVFSH